MEAAVAEAVASAVAEAVTKAGKKTAVGNSMGTATMLNQANGADGSKAEGAADEGDDMEEEGPVDKVGVTPGVTALTCADDPVCSGPERISLLARGVVAIGDAVPVML